MREIETSEKTISIKRYKLNGLPTCNADDVNGVWCRHYGTMHFGFISCCMLNGERTWPWHESEGDYRFAFPKPNTNCCVAWDEEEIEEGEALLNKMLGESNDRK